MTDGTGPAGGSEPAPGRFSTRGIAVRLFFTCWLVYGLHFATNTVREIYLGLAIGDHFSFRLDEYAHLHPDIFETPGRGWHHAANPGASMVAAIPYALSRPIIDRVVERVNRLRAERGLTEPPAYDSPWPMARAFYREAWRRGLDVKFGLGAWVMHAFAMAPISAAGVVVMFYLLRPLLGADGRALWLALLYAFGTPVFFRTGYLNHNMMLGHVAFFGFFLMWNPSGNPRMSSRARFFLGGVAGGLALLFDYTGTVILLALIVYGLLERLRAATAGDAIRHGIWYVLGTLPPVGLLWLYQYESFGNAFYPAQQWMPAVQFVERGYRGMQGPQLDLFLLSAFDYRYGLFAAGPLLLLGLAAPFVNRGRGRRLPGLEMTWLLALFVVFWVFLSGVNYGRLQFNTGVRYFASMIPFVFVLTAVVLARLPRPVVYFVAVASVAQSWALAMYRDVERGAGVVEPILQVFLGGFQLPALTVLSRMGDQYGSYVAHGPSPLPLFALAGTVIYGLWAPALYRDRRP